MLSLRRRQHSVRVGNPQTMAIWNVTFTWVDCNRSSDCSAGRLLLRAFIGFLALFRFISSRLARRGDRFFFDCRDYQHLRSRIRLRFLRMFWSFAYFSKNDCAARYNHTDMFLDGKICCVAAQPTVESLSCWRPSFRYIGCSMCHGFPSKIKGRATSR